MFKGHLTEQNLQITFTTLFNWNSSSVQFEKLLIRMQDYGSMCIKMSVIRTLVSPAQFKYNEICFCILNTFHKS